MGVGDMGEDFGRIAEEDCGPDVVEVPALAGEEAFSVFGERPGLPTLLLLSEETQAGLKVEVAGLLDCGKYGSSEAL